MCDLEPFFKIWLHSYMIATPGNISAKTMASFSVAAAFFTWQHMNV